MNNIYREKIHLWAAGLAFMLLFTGCAKIKEITHIGKAEKISYYTHTVQWSGETLSIIAGWYTGDIENWKALVKANPDINPNLIVKGIKIRIPEDLLKKKDPMPKNYVESFYQKPAEKVPAGAASPPSPKKEEEEKISYYMHTVQWSGETLSIIAGWYTGDIGNWKALVKANPDINPNLIVKGIKIRIPEDLLKKKDPMPKNYVESFYQKPVEKVAPGEASPPSPREERPELFGPK